MSRNTAPASAGQLSAMMTRPKLPSVNLLPATVTQGHERRRLQILVLGVAGVVVVALVLGYFGLALWRGAARDRLADAKAESDRIAQQRLQYSDLIAITERLAAADAAYVTTMGYEVLWADLMEDILNSKPQPSGISSISVTSLSASDALSPIQNPLAPAGVGQIQIQIDVVNTDAAAEWVDIMNSMPGVEYATWEAVSGRGGVNEENQFDYTVRCIAQVNLVRLSGEALGEEFQEWRQKMLHPELADTTPEEGK
jgi:Tfp pilus assembly protein PilN